MVIPDPRGVPWQQWADTVVGFNALLRNRIDPDSDWREFGETFCQYVPSVPYPEDFETWQEWAIAVKYALQD